MNKYVCIHGHFYQPPRENPWIEKVEQQDSAYPFHDWNERISFECYEPNTASRLLSDGDEIVEIQNNYAHMSYNLGPTLLSWLETHDKPTYEAIIESDKESAERFSGHGAAMAQCYNHMIMPLANQRDKETQVKWGIEDFKYRYGRMCEGMWLAETAVDVATLEAMAENGIKFTVLAPYQAGKIRRIGDQDWKQLNHAEIDPKKSYLCNLPSGKSIYLFFYDGPLSNDVAFKGLLKDGKKYAERILEVFDYQNNEPQLVHLATDGESYGHHHRFGDMALAYCLHHIDKHPDYELTVYGEYLEKFPPEYEVEINENTSWSCGHGIERWRSGCSCKLDNNPMISTDWRKYLRETMDFLRDQLIDVYEEESKGIFKDPWSARNDYIKIILKRDQKERDQFFKAHSSKTLSQEERIKANKLLEMQRHAMLMFTSCGWFFDDIARLEPVQIFKYAARAMQLANEVNGIELQKDYLKILKKANCNDRKYKNGADVFEKEVNAVVTNFKRVGSHYAIASLFRELPEEVLTDGFIIKDIHYKKTESGTKKICVGQSIIQSNITEEEKTFGYAVIHLGDNNILGGISENLSEEQFFSLEEELKEVFLRNDIPRIMDLLDKSFGSNSFSFWHLFRDEQIYIINSILDQKKEELTKTYGQLYSENYPFMRVMVDRGIAMPRSLSIPGEFMVNQELSDALASEPINKAKILQVKEQIKSFSFEIDKTKLGFDLSNKIHLLMMEVESGVNDLAHFDDIEFFLQLASELEIEVNVWKSQNIFYNILKTSYDEVIQSADRPNDENEKWAGAFARVAKLLKIKI